MSQVVERSPLDQGRDAVARHAWREGFDLLSIADSDQALGPEDLEKLAEAAWWSGRLDDCIAARERAYNGFLQAGEPRKAALVALYLSEDFFAKRANSVGAGWFSRAERLLADEGDCVEQGHLAVMRAHGALMSGDLDAALTAARHALEIGMRFGNRDLQGFGLLFEGNVHVSKGEVERGLAMLDEATVAAVGGEFGPHATGMIYCLAIHTTAQLADYDRAGQWTEASRRWCERQSIAGFPGICRVHRAEIMRLRGSWTEAEEEARRALTELKSFNLQFAGEGLYELGEVRLRMGDLDGAEEAFRQAHELGREPQPGLALLRLAEGKAQPAFTSLRRALDDVALDRLQRARLIPALVETAIAVGEIETARGAVGEFERIVETFDSIALRASFLCSRGAVELAEGDAPTAARSLRESQRLWVKADLPYEAARTRLALAAALRAEGDEDSAVLELRAARSAFEKLGAVIDLKRTSEMLGDEAAQMRASKTRVIKTFMFTDIVGSTKTAEFLGEEEWGALLGWHDATLRELFEENRGEEIKHTGDGFFVAFGDAVDAAACAVSIQRRVTEKRKEIGLPLRVRIGLHHAQVTKKGRDYEGTGVHAAARIGAAAEADEILVSEVVADAVRYRFTVSEAREVPLKGFSGTMRVASIQPS